MSDKIVYTVPGYKLLKDLQNEILEENELDSRFHNNSSLHKSLSKNLCSKPLLPQKSPTIRFSELASPSHNLLSTMKDNLNITSLLLKNKKPNTASGLTNDRLKTLTFNSNFSTTNNFFTNKDKLSQNLSPFNTQELNVTTLSRIAIRNSKQRKIAINVNEERNAMIPAGYSQLPEIRKENKSLFANSAINKGDLLRLRHDEAKLEKIIASNDQKMKEIHEIENIVKKKLIEKNEFNKEYFNKKDPFWRSFFEEKKAIEQNEACNRHFQRRKNERIQSYQDDKYRKLWMNLRVGKHKTEKSPLLFGREDLRKFEEILAKLKKTSKNCDEINTINTMEFKRSRTNLSKLSSETKMEKD